MRVVLASTSPWRVQLLARAGVRCEALAPEVDERAFPERDPALRAEGLARLKAEAVARRLEPGALVIGADQVAHVDGEVLGKPGTIGAQRRQLRRLLGRSHELITGVCVASSGAAPAAPALHFCERSIIHFRIDLSELELEAYLATGEGRQACGGYQVEGLGAQLIERIEGDWYNVVGLPILRVIGALRQRGWRPWPPGGSP